MKVIDTIIKWMMIVLMSVITIIGAYQVITRYVFNNASYWSEEAMRFLFIWISMLGSAMGVGRNTHTGVDFFINLCPKSVQKIAEYISYAVIIVFGAVITWLGWKLMMGTVLQRSPAIGISMAYVYAALPVGGLLTSLYAIDNTVKMIKNGLKKNAEGTAC